MVGTPVCMFQLSSVEVQYTSVLAACFCLSRDTLAEKEVHCPALSLQYAICKRVLYFISCMPQCLSEICVAFAALLFL